MITVDLLHLVTIDYVILLRNHIELSCLSTLAASPDIHIYQYISVLVYFCLLAVTNLLILETLASKKIGLVVKSINNTLPVLCVLNPCFIFRP